MMPPEPKGGKAAGGHARAESLSADERSSIASKAAKARWSSPVPRDPELEFLAKAALLLDALTPEARRRVLFYLRSRWPDEADQ